MTLWVAPLVATVAELLQFPALVEGLNTRRVAVFGVVTLLVGLTYGFAFATWWVRR